MLANLGNDEEMPSMLSGSASPPRSGGGMLNTNNIPDIDAENGKWNGLGGREIYRPLLLVFQF